MIRLTSVDYKILTMHGFIDELINSSMTNYFSIVLSKKKRLKKVILKIVEFFFAKCMSKKAVIRKKIIFFYNFLKIILNRFLKKKISQRCHYLEFL